MTLRSLRQYNSPDLSPYVVHLTGRTGRKPDSVPAAICNLTPAQRLVGILDSGSIAAFEPFGGASHSTPVVCFSECTPAGISASMASGNYQPFGIAFRKDVVFQAGGGPVYYVRGDDWHPVVTALPPDLAARCVRYWPGSVDNTGALVSGDLSWSEWTHEREWRVVPPTGEYSFAWEEIAFLILRRSPVDNWRIAWGLRQAGISFSEFNALPQVFLNDDGTVARDDRGFWR